MNKLQLATGLLSAVLTAPVLAQSTLFEFNGLVAPAISIDQLPYKDTDTQVSPSLLVMGHAGRLFIEGNRAGYRLNRSDFGALSVLGQWRTHQYIPDDAPFEQRDKAVELGIQLAKPLGSGWNLQASALTDISNKHQGQEYELGLYRRDNIGSLRLLSLVAVQQQSKQLTGYYADTEGYQADADTNVELEFIGIYPITGDIEAVAIYRHYFHGSELKNSPLTDSRSTKKLSLGLGWRF